MTQFLLDGYHNLNKFETYYRYYVEYSSHQFEVDTRITH